MKKAKGNGKARGVLCRGENRSAARFCVRKGGKLFALRKKRAKKKKDQRGT